LPLTGPAASCIRVSWPIIGSPTTTIASANSAMTWPSCAPKGSWNASAARAAIVPRPVLHHPFAEPIQRRVRAAAWPKSVRAIQKILLEDRAEYPRHGLLHHPVFNRGDAYRPKLSVCLRDVHPPNHWRLIASSCQSRV